MRLNAYLARAGVASRRGADELIKAGRVTVNGNTGKLNTDIEDNDKVKLDGKLLSSQKLRYILINKPKGTLTTMSDPHGRRKILDMLSISERVVPVGRLDYDTTGVLLLTNDGQLAHRLMHPSFKIKKTYIASIKGEITNDKLDKLRQGVQLEDGLTAPAEVRSVRGPTSHKERGVVELTIHEGRNHQVKRMLAKVGLEVTGLHRSGYGNLTAKDLQPGKWRDLTKEEIKALRMLN